MHDDECVAALIVVIGVTWMDGKRRADADSEQGDSLAASAGPACLLLLSHILVRRVVEVVSGEAASVCGVSSESCARRETAAAEVSGWLEQRAYVGLCADSSPPAEI